MWPFTNNQQTSQPGNQQQPSGNQQQPGNQQNAGNGNQPGVDPNSNSGGQQNPPPEGLDKFAHLLDNASNKDGEGGDPNSQKQPTNVPELFKDENFTKGLRTNLRQSLNTAISPETKALMEANDPNAMMSMMQDIAEASYMQALQHASSLNGIVLNEKMEGLNVETSNLVDSKLQSQEFTQAIPQLKNPIVKLGVEAFMDKVREQNPTISPEDMKAQITEYVGELGKDLGAVPQGSSNQEPESDVDKGIDWFEELGIQPPPDNS